MKASAGFDADVLLLFGGGGGGGGSGAGLISGESRKTDGDGIVMISISSTSGARTLAAVVRRELSPASQHCFLSEERQHPHSDQKTGSLGLIKTHGIGLGLGCVVRES